MSNTLSKTARTHRTVALLDANAPARTQRPVADPDPLVLRVPDFYEDGFAVFIGEDAAVLVETKALSRLDVTLPLGGTLARTGHFPVERGIVVQPFTGALEHPACSGKHREAQAAWRIAQDTLVQEYEPAV